MPPSNFLLQWYVQKGIMQAGFTLVHSFQATSHSQNYLGMTDEYALLANQYIAVHFFHGFLLHMVFYAKFILISYFCLIIPWRIKHPHLDIKNVIKCLNIWFILRIQKLHVL